MNCRTLAFVLATFPIPAYAGPISLDGITFVEASDNLRLLAAGGRGTLDDPFVIREEIFGDGEAVLKVSIDARAFGSRIGTTHEVGFALLKEVRNRTKEAWDFFTIELQPEIGKSSDYYDGLSFAQSTQANRPFRSDRFENVEDITEPRDMLRFSGGRVEVAETVSFLLSITHTVPLPEFYLVQNAKRPFAMNTSTHRPAAYARSYDWLSAAR